MASVAALSQAVFDAAKGDRNLDRWACSLRTDADGEEQRPPSRPEFMELRSISHEGRVRWHRKQIFHPGLRPVKRPPRTGGRPLIPQEQLLYVALYRDKIAQHQAELETTTKAAQAKESAKRRELERQERHERRGLLVPVRPNRAAAKLAAAAATVAGANLDGSEGGVDMDADSEAAGADVSASGSSAAPTQQERGASMPPLRIPSERRGPRRSGVAGSGSISGVDGTGRPSGGDEAASGSRARRPGAASARRSDHAGEDQEGRAATHIASVTATPGAGGVANEYLEAKRLGKLFDEWKAQQLQQQVEEPGASSSPRLSTVRFADSEPSPRMGVSAKRMGGPDGSTPRGGAGSGRSMGSGTGAAASPSARGQVTGASASHVPMTLPTGSQRPTGKGEGPASAGSSATSGGLMTPTSPGQGSSAQSETSGSAKAKRNVAKAKAATSEHTPSAKAEHRVPSLTRRPSMIQDEGYNESDFDALSSDLESDNQAVGGEHRLVSRLFQVVTNPKVTRETFGLGGDSTKRGEVPSHVEGFPTLNLMRLYKGPWRLDV